MGSSLTDIIQAVCSVITVLLAIAGVYFVLVELRHVRQSIQSNTYGALCEQSIPIVTYIADHPEVYPYLYTREYPLPADNAVRVQVELACELVANFMEMAALQQACMSEKTWSTWKAFIQSTFEGSPVLVDFVTRSRGWYCEELLKFLPPHPSGTSGSTVA